MNRQHLEMKDAPGRCSNTAEGQVNTHNTKLEGYSVDTVPTVQMRGYTLAEIVTRRDLIEALDHAVSLLALRKSIACPGCRRPTPAAELASNDAGVCALCAEWADMAPVEVPELFTEHTDAVWADKAGHEWRWDGQLWQCSTGEAVDPCSGFGPYTRIDSAPVTALPDPPVPDGAEGVADWDELDTRTVYGPTHTVGNFECHALAVQARSGAILDDPIQEAPMVCVYPDDEISCCTPARARQIAANLIAAADLADDWAGQVTR